jgi:hypothetical protein
MTPTDTATIEQQVGLLTDLIKALRTATWTGPGSVDAIYCSLKGGLDQPDYTPSWPTSAGPSELAASSELGTRNSELVPNGPYWSDPSFEADLTRYSTRIQQLLGPAIARFARAQARLETGNSTEFSTPLNFGNIGNTDDNPKGGPGFATPEAAADAWVAFVTNSGGPTRYQPFLDAGRAGASVADLAQLIASEGYATDPNYAAKVAALAD